MQFILNGNKKEYTGDPKLSLLTYLREHEGITSPKDGCAPQASCGCCVVELNGKGVLSCVIPMKKVEGGDVITIEGIGEYRQRVFANAFVEKSGVQCGFCIPGIVMQAKVLIDKNPSPTRDEVERAINPNLCRCTGYKKIVDSILYAAEAIKDLKEIPTPKTDGKIGKRHPKYNAANLVLGKSPFVADMQLEGMVHGALKFSDHSRAKVLSINFSNAEKLSGVLKVFTAKDIPGNRYSGLIISDWPLMIDVGEETRYVGDVIAAVVAETEKIAREAAKLIEVEYEVLKPLTDPEQALDDDINKIHPKGNLLSETIINRGEVERALDEADYISTGVYYTQRIEHGYMETECSIARTTDHGVEVLSQGQGIYDDQKQIADILNLPLDKVRVILVPNGGAFGGKEDLSVQGHAALFSYLLKKPVKVFLNRDESIIMHPKRHPMRLNYTLGCNKKGKLTVLQADILGDTGAYASVGMKVLERAAGHATGPYHIPNVNVVSRAVYTNNLPSGAMRGFGVNQVTFAVESCIDDLCEKGGFDRWQFRYDNTLIEGDMTSTGQIIHAGSGVRQTLLAVKDIFKKAKFAGIACGIKNTGIGNGMADEGKIKIEIISEKKIILNHGWTEMGQGVNTMAIQFLCEETGVDPDIVEVRVDTAEGATAGMTTASRATSIIGNSIANTCKKLKEDLKTQSLNELRGKVYYGEWVCDWTTKPGDETKEIITHYSYSYATQVVVLDDEGKIDTVYAAHDAGKIINPSLFEGQIEGSIHMGLGYALTEDLELEEGIPKSTKLRKCGILRAKEMPKMEVIGIEVPDPHGPYGVKGVGEIGLVPTAAAVANAFYQYDGTRYYKLPIKKRIKVKK
ncbi:MAG: selenium-dependent xanthine dehydrogenase [Ignavibacteria bacterium RBG_16_35_7]|nr:MAG: selenium-dependent xanthine dehydrogenase [Ignavibacteria bacterium RBG_16_35_7]